MPLLRVWYWPNNGNKLPSYWWLSRCTSKNVESSQFSILIARHLHRNKQLFGQWHTVSTIALPSSTFWKFNYSLLFGLENIMNANQFWVRARCVCVGTCKCPIERRSCAITTRARSFIRPFNSTMTFHFSNVLSRKLNCAKKNEKRRDETRKNNFLMWIDVLCWHCTKHEHVFKRYWLVSLCSHWPFLHSLSLSLFHYHSLVCWLSRRFTRSLLSLQRTVWCRHGAPSATNSTIDYFCVNNLWILVLLLFVWLHWSALKFGTGIDSCKWRMALSHYVKA